MNPAHIRLFILSVSFNFSPRRPLWSCEVCIWCKGRPRLPHHWGSILLRSMSRSQSRQRVSHRRDELWNNALGMEKKKGLLFQTWKSLWDEDEEWRPSAVVRPKPKVLLFQTSPNSDTICAAAQNRNIALKKMDMETPTLETRLLKLSYGGFSHVFSHNFCFLFSIFTHKQFHCRGSPDQFNWGDNGLLWLDRGGDKIFNTRNQREKQNDS